MSTSVSAVTKHFPSAQNGFTTTLASTVASGATTVPLNSVAGYNNGEIAVMVVEPSSTTAKQTFTGVVDTSGVQLTSVVWTAGTNQTHNSGSTVVDYETATHWSMMTKGLLRDHNQSGYHKALHDDNANTWIGQTSTASAVNYVNIANSATGTDPVMSALGSDSNVGLVLTPKGNGSIKMTSRADGWVTGLTAPTTVTALGNRSYTVVINSTDYTDRLSAGMRVRLTRTVTAPTQCTSLNGSTQFYSKSSPAGMTFTNNFVVSAWVKLSSYPAAGQTIMSRYNGTSGWSFQIEAAGRLQLVGFNAGSSNISYSQSAQSVPLNKWVHVAGQLDMSTFTASTTTTYLMIDGVDVPTSVARSGTNPTALVQAGNLEIGSQNAGLLPFSGKIAQAAVYSAKVTQANILATISQGLVGTETSLVSAYSFNNSINDLNVNANNLTANGSAIATNADSPFGSATQPASIVAGTTEYGIVTAASFSTNTTLTVYVPEGGALPTTGGISTLAYSTQKIPYGFPVQKTKWQTLLVSKTAASQSSPVSGTWYNLSSIQLNVPVGEWSVKYSVEITPTASSSSTSNFAVQFTTLSSANNTESDSTNTSSFFGNVVTSVGLMNNRELSLSLTSATVYFLNHKTNSAATNTVQVGSDVFTYIIAENAYL